MRAAKPGEGFVVFGGRVRLTPVYPNMLAATQALGGVPCWIITGRPSKGGYQTLIVPAMRREERDGRHSYTWIDENGIDHYEQSYRVEAFDSAKAAKAELVKRASDSVKHALGQVKAQRAELRRVRALKPFPPMKATNGR